MNKYKIMAIMGFLLLAIMCQGTGEKIYIIKASLSQNPGEPQVRAVKLF